MNRILPSTRPRFSEETVLKVFRYFFDEKYREYPLILLGIRNPKINFYDDELAVYSRGANAVASFNFNADPSAYLLRGEPKAILKKGVHFYRISYHKINTPARRRFALRPATEGERLPVWRRSANGKLTSSVGIAIDIHDGGDDSTWSEGCQTIYRSQYQEFLNLVGNAFGVRLAYVYGIKAEQRFVKGLGKIPYILLDQSDYDYIKNLPETQFDSKADLIYQAKNFVGVPKIEKIVPVETEIENASAILASVEIDAAEAIVRGENITPIQSPPNAGITLGGYLQTAQAGIQKAQEAADVLGQAKATFDQVKNYLPGTGANDPAVKVTSGKKTNFFFNLVGYVISFLGLVWAFMTDNWRMIAVFFVGLLCICGLITWAFTKTNVEKMQARSDPNKFNVE